MPPNIYDKNPFVFWKPYPGPLFQPPCLFSPLSPVEEVVLWHINALKVKELEITYLQEESWFVSWTLPSRGTASASASDLGEG